MLNQHNTNTVLALVAAGSLALSACGTRTGTTTEPDPRMAAPAPADAQTLVLAGGCFWCTEAVFEELAGVGDVVSGYAGGQAEDANYSAVSAGRTDHAEVIQVPYDPDVVSLEELLEVFFLVAHDPTQLNRQGPDRGRQYRSAVFFASAAEEQATRTAIAALEASGTFDDPIVTTLEPLERFYPAEKYHQDYVREHPTQPYVVHNALPKVAKLKKRFPERLGAR